MNNMSSKFIKVVLASVVASILNPLIDGLVKLNGFTSDYRKGGTLSPTDC